MTRLRRALVLVSVVLFALALGIAIGGGPLQGPIRTALQSQMAAVTDDTGPNEARLARKNRALSRSARSDSAFAQAVSPEVLGNALAGRTVAVLALPGVPERVSENVAADVETAGGSVTTSLRVGRRLVDPTARPLVDELSERLLADIDDRDVPAEASVYTRVGVVAARALLTTDDDGVAMDESAQRIFDTFTTARLLTGEQPQERASLAVVLVPEAGGAEASAAGRNTVLTEMVAALDDAGDGVVVGGPPSAAAEQGMVAAVRTAATTAETVSTVDTAGLRTGQIVTVLALAEQAAGATGHYGTVAGADAVAP